MGRLFFRLYSYLRYYILANNASYIHSHFIFNWHQSIYRNIPDNSKRMIDQFLNIIKNDHSDIELNENSRSKKIAVSIRYSTTGVDSKYGRCLYQTGNYIAAENILELGTSLGSSMIHMAAVPSRVYLQSIDYQASLIHKVKSVLEDLDYSRGIRLVNANFDDVLNAMQEKYDMVYIDGDHQYNSTLRYVGVLKGNLSSQSVIILDDIRWSKQMNEAWKVLVEDTFFNYTVDFGRMGFLFRVSNQAPKQHFILK